jgi:hypothetical protein
LQVTPRLTDYFSKTEASTDNEVDLSSSLEVVATPPYHRDKFQAAEFGAMPRQQHFKIRTFVQVFSLRVKDV